VPSASSAEAVEVGDLIAEDGATSTSTASPRALLFFIGVAEDDDLAVTGRSYDVAVEVAKSLVANTSSRKTLAMRSPSSEDEERSTVGAFPEDPLAPTSMSGGGMRKPSMETSAAMVVQMVPAVESWHRLVMDSPL
jgi:hypothetical protein